MAVNLTANAIARICSGELEGEGLHPIVQVADLKLVASGTSAANERYIMVISDGLHTQQGMLATQMNDLVHSGQLQKGSIVELSDFVRQLVQKRTIIVIIGLKVIVEKCQRIGAPKQYEEAPARIIPIAALCPYMARWTIKARVTSKKELRRYTNAKGEGKVFSFDILDSDGGKIQVTCFNDVADQFYDQIEAGKVYLISRGSVNVASKNFTGFPTEYVITLENTSSIQPCVDDHTIPRQPPPRYMDRGTIAKNEALGRIIPIADLNPYLGKWTIKARVTSKKEMRRYNNARGEGKVFSFDLLDSDGGEIQVTCFNAVADQFYHQIEAGKVYLISRGLLKPASSNINRLRNEYEITLENTSSIQACAEDDHTIPRQQFHFRPISDIETMEINSMLDIIGVVSSINPTQIIMAKNGTETQKKSLQLKDMSGRSVELTLWGSICTAEGQELQNKHDEGGFPVLAVKSVRVNELNVRSVGTLSMSQLFIEPDFPEAHRLREWFDFKGKNTPAIPISKVSLGMGRLDVRKTVSQIKDERLGTSEKPDWITVKATVFFVKFDNFCYTACPLMVGDRLCSKKVTYSGDGLWRCDRCDQSVVECDYRYILQLHIQDVTGLTWVTTFQETGEKIMGISAKELFFLKSGDREKFMDILKGVLFTEYIFKLKVKEETFGDEQRVKSTVVMVEKLNFSTESSHLLDLMDRHLVKDANGVLAAVSGSETGMISKGCQNMGRLTTPSVGSSRRNASTGKDFRAFPINPTGCYKCGLEGHWSRDCPVASSSSMYGSSGLSGRYGGFF